LTTKSQPFEDSQPSGLQQLRAENTALQAELDRLRELMDFQQYRRHEFAKMLKVGFWEYDEIARKPIRYSPEIANVLGVDDARLEELFLTANAFRGIVHPDDVQLYDDNLSSRSHLSGSAPYVFEYRVLASRRETRYIREYEQGVFDADGNLVSSFGLVQNITAERTAVNALKESEERYHSLFEQMPLGVQEEDYSEVKKVVDKLLFQGVEDIETYFRDDPRALLELVKQTRITHVNEALLRMHSADDREQFFAIEADVDDWWDMQWVEYYAAEIAALAGDRKIYEAERVDSQVDGSYIETRSIVSLVSGCEDTWERVITIHEDISLRKRAEASLIEAKNHAELANQAKSDFLSSMSHELRTPLNAILGFSQLFYYDRDLDEQHLANAREINRAGKHLMSLIDQILDLSRIEAGEIELSLEPLSLQSILSDSVTWITPLARKRDIGIDFDASQFTSLNVVADSIRLKQVFLNLLANAVKYNQDGGRVSVIIDSSNEASIRIGVRDTGIGISAEKLKEMFQPFNRLGAEFSGIEGTGIGLVISRQLVSLMKGELEIESEVGVGSTFWVSLQQAPALKSVDSASAANQSIAGKSLGHIKASRILVAEDNLINQELMTAQLSLLGYQADYADNGALALECWQRGGYDLLLTDIRMPEMNGYELVRKIRMLEQDSGGRAPLIAITANALEHDVKKCYAVGVDDVIAKPVDLDVLRSALDKWTPVDRVQTAPKAVVGNFALSTDDSIDFDVLNQATGNNPGLHRSLLESFREALADEIDNIQQAFAWKNGEQIAEYAHKLKSSSRSLGITGLAQSCEQIETAARSNAWDELEKRMPGFLRLSAAATESINAFTGEGTKPGSQAADDPVLQFGLPNEEDDITQFSIRVLLVDDDYIMHRVTTVMLNDLGFSKVMNAMSGPAALEILQARIDYVDVIICDLNMPEMDGVKFIRHLANLKFPGSLILTSGEDLRILRTVEKLANEHELHVLGILQKPATPAKLGELLDSLDQVQQEGTIMMADNVTLPELENAINNGELDTFFQPKIDIVSGRVVGVEALARWHHPMKGLIRPDAFISMAEEHGIISSLTDAVCRKAMDYAGQLNAMGHDLNVAINLSVDSLDDLEWPEKISAILQEYGLEAGNISFEITESRLMEHVSVALDILSRLSLKRFNLSIDDFGTGYSSMEQLQRIPFSEFKIDRAFVHGAAREASALAILESSVLLAKKLHMKVVAEGVEDQQDWDVAARAGCDQIQGYFVSRPLSFPQLLKWLDDPQNQKKFIPDA
jgi:EAL domain-containing protein (putative c-di-GMP-specific phosphodiesterase class I)/signal transduction histidine kinase/DNA-binding response OmpR family regulator